MSIATSLVRLFSIGLVLYAFKHASFYVQILFDQELGFDFGYVLISGVLVPLLIAFVLWVFPEKVTGHFSVQSGDEDLKDVQANSFFSAGAGLIGLYLMVTSTSSVLEWVLRYRAESQLVGETLYATSMNFSTLFAELFLLLAGLVLLVGASGIARIVHRLRNYGIEG